MPDGKGLCQPACQEEGKKCRKRKLKANDSGWPVFDGRYVNYPRLKKEWVAYRETYHSVVNHDLAAKTLQEKCVKVDAWKMVGHLEDLKEIWDTLDTCYERPEKYMEEALKPILEFRKYRVYDNGAVREFYSILQAAIKGARAIGRIDLLINDQMVPKHGEDSVCRLDGVGHQAA